MAGKPEGDLTQVPSALGLRHQNQERVQGATMSTFTYDHIHIRSRDPEKTAAYYERMFEAQIIRSVQEGAPRIDMKIGGQDVFIAPVPEKSNVNPPPVTPYPGL